MDELSVERDASRLVRRYLEDLKSLEQEGALDFPFLFDRAARPYDVDPVLSRNEFSETVLTFCFALAAQVVAASGVELSPGKAQMIAKDAVCTAMEDMELVNRLVPIPCFLLKMPTSDNE